MSSLDFEKLDLRGIFNIMKIDSIKFISGVWATGLMTRKLKVLRILKNSSYYYLLVDDYAVDSSNIIFGPLSITRSPGF